MYKKREERVMDFTKFKPVVEIPNLLQIQRYSFENFLQRDVPPQQRKKEGLQKIFVDAFPVESYNQKLILEFVEYRFGESAYDIEKCQEEELTYCLPFYVKLRLKKKGSGRGHPTRSLSREFSFNVRKGKFYY